MAKDKTDLDDINFDDEDLNFDFDMTPPKDDRSPVKKIASGAVKGFTSTLKSPKFLKDTLLKTLPPGYSKLDTMVGDVGYELSDLYDSTAKELEPMRKLGIKATKAAMGKLKGKLPKKLEDKLQDIIDRDELNKNTFKVDQDKANMALELGEIFKTQMEQQQQISESDRLDKRLETGINFKQHKESIIELASMRQGIDRIVGYQDSINFKYQKKSLELQFKQYFIQRDMLELARTTDKVTMETLQNIMKNTALPDNVKVNKGEVAKSMLLERSLKSMGGMASDFAPNFIKEMGGNIKNRMKFELGALTGMAGAADMVDVGMLESMGIDPMSELGESLIGSSIADTFGYAFARKIKGKLPFQDKINKYGNKASILVNEAPQRMQEWAQSRTPDNAKLGGLQRFIKGVTPKYSMRTQLEGDSITQLDKATAFDNQTRKSIVEIIPGYLSRILQSIDIMRTGNEKTDLLSYDLSTNRFANKEDVKAGMIKKIFSTTNLQRANNDTESILEHLESKGTSLPDGLKKILKTQMLSDGQNNKRVSIERYMDEKNLNTVNDPTQRALLVNFFKELNAKDDEDGSFKEELSNRAIALKYSMPNTKLMAQEYINAGYGSILQETGLIDKAGINDNLNFARVLQGYSDGTGSFLGGSTGAAPNTPGGRRGRGGNATQAKLSELVKQLNAQASTRGIGEQQSGMQNTDCCETLKSTIDEIRDHLINSFTSSSKMDEDRNTKLDEIILRIEGLGVDGKVTGPGSKSFKERAKNISLSVKGQASSMYKKVTGYGKSYMNTLGRMYGGAGSLISKAIPKIQLKADKAKETLKDIYVKGNMEVAKLTAEGFKNGEYRDKITGKIITSYEDIKGEVVDKYDKTLITLQDIKEGFVDQHGNKIKGFISKFQNADPGLLKKLGGAIKEDIISLIKMPFKIVRWGFNKIKNSDLYLAGSKKVKLTYSKLQNGEYFDGETGEVLTDFKNIKNGVKNKLGEWLVTPDELAGGSFSLDGSVITKPFKWLGDVAGGAIKGVWNISKKMTLGAAGLMGSIASKFKGKLTAVDQQVLLLTEIRDILKDRLADQTADRAGSAEDLINRKKGKLAGLKDKLIGGKKGKDKDGNDTKGTGLLGMMGSLGGAISGLTSILGGLFKLPGLAVRGIMTAGSAIMTAGSALLSSGAVASTVGAIGTGLSAVGGAAMTALSALSLPVVLGVAAVAVAAYGGYKLYKYLKNKDAYLGKIRMAQYGIDYTDSSRVSKIGDLESLVAPLVKSGANGYSLALDQKTASKILDIFDIDPKDARMTGAFGKWFSQRFQPVFLAHCKAAKQYGLTDNVSEADEKVPLKYKLEYMKLISFPETGTSPYMCVTNPFDGEETLTAGAPKAIIEQATAYYKEQMEKEGISTGGPSATGPQDKKDKPKGLLSKIADIAIGLTPMGLIKKGFGAIADSSWGKAIGNLLPSGKTIASMMFKYSIPGLIDSATGGKLGDLLFTGNADKIDPLIASRLSAYGLSDLNDSGKCSALSRLEHMVFYKARISKDGGVNIDLKEDEVFANHASLFGLDLENADDKITFNLWFKSRFLPVALKYASLLKVMYPDVALTTADSKLKPSEKIPLIKELKNVKMTPDSSTSVWSVTISPFPDIKESNTDSSCLDKYIDKLKSMSSEKEVESKINAATTKKTGVSITDKISSMYSSMKDKAKEIADKAAKLASEAANAAKAAAGSVVNKVGSIYQGAKDAAGNVVSGAGAALVGAGNVITTGAGAAYKAIKGDKAANQAAMIKELLAQGVTDPTEQAMYMAQMDHESGGFGFLSENLKYRAAGLMKIFGRHIHGSADAEALAKAGPEAIANRVYGNRMGNTEPGDGFKYRGRGFIQLTGKENYMKAGAALGLDLINNPDLASQPANAAKIAWWYLKNRVSAAAAKAGDIKTVTKQINGGYNHLAERAQKFREYLTGIKEGKIPGLGGAPEAVVTAGATPIPGGATGSVAGTTPTPANSAPPPPAGLAPVAANGPPKAAVAGIMGMNAFDLSGMPKAPTTQAAAATTQTAMASAASNADQQAIAAQDQGQYQAVALDAQRKVSNDFLNGGIDKMGGVLGEQLEVQKSIDAGIKELVSYMKSGKGIHASMDTAKSNIESDQDQSNGGRFAQGKQTRGPVTVSRTNV